MVEKLKKISTKQIVMFSVLAFMLVLVVGTTYAYFTARVVGNDEAKDTQVYAGIMSLKLDGTQELNANNMLPGATKEVEFSVENTGTLTTTYEIDMKEVYNDFYYKDELVYTLEQDGSIVKEETEAPSLDEVLLPAVVINPGDKQTYKLKLTFIETGDEQNYNQNKTFTGKIQISGIDSSNYLQAKVLARSINTKEPDFEIADPSPFFKERIPNNKKYSSTVYVNDEVIIGTDYEFNEKKGLFMLKDTQTKATYDSNDIGKYTCRNISKVKSGAAKANCTSIIKIESVESTDKTVNFKESITENQSVSYTSDNNKLVADSYTFDGNTGIYKLENSSEAKSYDTTDIGKYTCNSTSNECKTMYKINVVDTTNVTSVNKYTAADEGIIKATGTGHLRTNTGSLKSNSGLYQGKDDEGDTYYFRGKIDNNYVSFANKLWRVVRINGDGSIRLKLNDNIGFGLFSSRELKEKNAGYTYDNDHICTKENPCLTTTGTNSLVKTDLEDWYNTNLSEYTDKIVLGSFCNDTSNTVKNDIKIYGAKTRVENNNPTLDCPNTTENYGGYYKLKVGLMSIDEMMYGGYSNNQSVDSNNYLYYFTYSKTLSPYNYNFSTESTQLYMLTSGKAISSNLLGSHNPVINLKSDIQIISGGGSKSNPYVVE